MNALTAKNLIVKKDKVTILDGLDFTLRGGSITGLIGPSGSGKTTLMRAIVGVQAYSGNLQVLGKPASDKSLRSRIGYVTQSPAIYNDLTVGQNLHYFMTIAQASNHDVEEIIQIVHLDKQHNQLVGSLSGGQRARVSLAIALLGAPDLLVLDEPTVGLDPILREELWQLFADLAAAGKTIIVSSHVMDEAERCEDLLLMRDGRLLWSNSRQSLLTELHVRTVEEAFIGMLTGAGK